VAFSNRKVAAESLSATAPFNKLKNKNDYLLNHAECPDCSKADMMGGKIIANVYNPLKKISASTAS
jgi:hypothetical protein